MRFVRFSILTFLPLLAAAAIWQALTWQDAPHKVALARAYVADPDLLVLDEATSAVDPATEMRIARALEGLTRGRTSITIAHRMSTAEAADEVLVFDAGRLAELGRHADLVLAGGTYARLYAAWTAQRPTTTPAPTPPLG